MINRKGYTEAGESERGEEKQNVKMTATNYKIQRTKGEGKKTLYCASVCGMCLSAHFFSYARNGSEFI